MRFIHPNNSGAFLPTYPYKPIDGPTGLELPVLSFVREDVDNKMDGKRVLGAIFDSGSGSMT